MKQWMKKTFAWVVALVMMLGCAMAAAEQTADLEALYPLMDLVCAAALDAQGEDDYAIVVPDSEGELTPEFVQAFIRIGQTRGESVGVTATMMTDTAAQKTLLSSIFDAQLPELTAVTAADGESNYIGFRPVTVNNTGENNTLQIIGEMSGTEFTDVTWLDRGIFTFRSDASALNGFRLVGFSSGTDLNMEEAFMEYNADTVVEYVNSKLGFTLSYPAVFDDELLKEDETGVSAELPDKSASFFARRIQNTDQSDLQSYVNVIASGLNGAKATVNDMNNYGTVAYTTDDGYTVFDVYLVSENYIYQAELKFLTEKSGDYSMYCSYLENSFASEEGAQG